MNYRVLDADGLRGAVAHACGMDISASAGAGRSVRERWSSWTVAGLAHASFTVTRWPPSADRSLLSQFARVPARAVNISLSVRRTGDRTAFSGVVRIVGAARPAAGQRAEPQPYGRPPRRPPAPARR